MTALGVTVEDNIRQYGVLARFYDIHGWQNVSRAWVERFQQFVKVKGLQPRLVYDVCCGTGEFLSQIGNGKIKLRVGADASEEMLAIARGKQIADTEFHLADVRTFRLEHPADVATCQYNSLNLMVGQGDLEGTLSSVAASLVPGGWFLFDIKFPVFYEENCRFGMVNRPSEFMVRDGNFDRTNFIASMQVEGFMRGADGRYDRFAFSQNERSWPFGKLAEMLSDCGFDAVEFIDEKQGFSAQDAAKAQKLFLAVQRKP